MNYKTLAELTDIKGGKRLPKGSQLQSEPNEHPYIRVRDMGSKYLPEQGLEYVPDSIFPKIQRYIVNTNDLLISIVGSIGLVSLIDERFNNASQTENTAKLSGLDEIDAHYLYYCLMSKDGQQQIKERTVGAVQPKLPLYNIAEIKVPWRTRIERAAIVKRLSFLDEKITNNQAMNQTLEKIAQRIFKSWFIDFDPVKANKEGLPFDGLSPEIQALFPSEFEDSELGMIPKGWNIEPIQKLSKVAIGKTPPRKQTQSFDNKATAENTKWFSIKDMGTNGVYAISSSECLTNEAIDKFNVKVIPADTVLLSFKLTLGRLTITTEECATNEAIAHFKLDDKHDSLTTNFIYYYMKNFNFNLLGSTSSIATAINSKMVKEIPVLHSDKLLM
ncbi:restriction endonuclease subunit S, partial [Vibrio rotiferianus]